MSTYDYIVAQREKDELKARQQLPPTQPSDARPMSVTAKSNKVVTLLHFV